MVEDREGVDGVDFDARQGSRARGRAGGRLLEEEVGVGGALRGDEFGSVVVDEAGVDAAGLKLGMLEQALQERNIGGDPFDTKLAQGAVGAGDRIGEGGRGGVADNFGEQGVEAGAGAVAGVSRRSRCGYRGRRVPRRR